MLKSVAFVVFVACWCLGTASGSGDVVVTEGVINASANDVYRAFTVKSEIETWMVATCDIELKVGGKMRTSYKKDSNLQDDSTIEHEILAFDPGRMFSFRTVKSPKGFPFPGALAKTWVVVYFEPLGPKKTKLTLRMLGFTEEEDSKKMRAFFEMGNKQTIDELVTKFGKA